MGSTDFETARKCPICKEPGELKSTREIENKSKVHIMTCKNERCRWFETDWIVQQLEDGTIPVRDDHEKKSFPSVRGMSQEAAQEFVERIDDARKPR